MTLATTRTALIAAIIVVITGCTQDNPQARREGRGIDAASIVAQSNELKIEEEAARTRPGKQEAQGVLRKDASRRMQPVPAPAAERAVAGASGYTAYDAAALNAIRLPSEKWTGKITPISMSIRSSAWPNIRCPPSASTSIPALTPTYAGC